MTEAREWKLVPVPATSEMMHAGVSAARREKPTRDGEFGHVQLRAAFAAMLSASPTPPVTGMTEDVEGSLRCLAKMVEMMPVFDLTWTDSIKQQWSACYAELARKIRVLETSPATSSESVRPTVTAEERAFVEAADELYSAVAGMDRLASGHLDEAMQMFADASNAWREHPGKRASAADAIERLSSPAKSGLNLDALRWRALMKLPRGRYYGSAGVDPNTGEKNENPGIHFMADFWSYGPVDDEQTGPKATGFVRNCLIALADDIIARDETITQPATSPAQSGLVEADHVRLAINSLTGIQLRLLGEVNVPGPLLVSIEADLDAAQSHLLRAMSRALPPNEGREAVIEEIAAERKRQVESEGWTAEHDDEHTEGEMACAAVCYIMGRTRFGDAYGPEVLWPLEWDEKWWKPGKYRRNLIKACALIIAEIERIDRSALKLPTPPSNGEGKL